MRKWIESYVQRILFGSREEAKPMAYPGLHVNAWIPNPPFTRRIWMQNKETLEALDCFRKEVRHFMPRGLKNLARDIENGETLGMDWESNCPLSYRMGYGMSAIQDRNGERDNAFLIVWRSGRIGPEDLLHEIKYVLSLSSRKIKSKGVVKKKAAA